MIAEIRTETLAELTTERAALVDRPALVAMYASFTPKAEAMGLPPVRPEGIAQWLERLAAYPNFVARAGERPVGHAVICPEGDAAEVAVFVHQNYRGRGAGRLLLNELIAEAQRLGLRRIWGIATPDNVAMLRLAHSCGFLPGEELGEFYRLLP